MPSDHTTCPDCGSPAPQTDQSFCDSCGAFLRWDRPASTADGRPAAAAPPAPGTPAPNVPAPADRAGTPAPTGRPAGTTPPTTPPAATPAPAPATGHTGGTGPAAAPKPDANGEPTTPLPSSAPHQEDTGRPRSGRDGQAGQTGQAGQDSGESRPGPAAPRPAGEQGVSETGIRALLVPVPGASATPPPEAPGSVLPGRPDAPRPRVRTPEAAPQPDNGAPCRSCGVLNAPGRHFCRSCALPLVETTRETADGPYAGQRPRLDRGRAKWIARAVVAAVIAGVVVGGIIGGPPAAQAVQDRFAKRVPVPATTWKASHSGPGHDAKLAFDGYSNTWWGTGYAGNSGGQYVEAAFGQPTDLLNILITPGASARTPQAADPARPHEFDLIVTDSAGKRHLSHARINDGGVQKIDVAVRNATTVRLVLRSAYGTAGDKQVAIAALEFFGRSMNS
ncbi:NADase-type glycan-binding domain-containing protein [Streptomyces sp. bgisy084]|uniref:NADase-type glycan-binding domain-containing protein n=1 Tax=Streptomyces sp. bgisy084 TaxID=3413777 RepID=UPI003D71771E